ncbi:hypothetical protein L218DRAFT_1080196 [Marasmius fiardii PR-910]|nr:hypothetical protein L218DRAFT_1080196 [Marasmius fiardii PR-910]
MTAGRPPKRKRNINGLQNQQKRTYGPDSSQDPAEAAPTIDAPSSRCESHIDASEGVVGSMDMGVVVSGMALGCSDDSELENESSSEISEDELTEMKWKDEDFEDEGLQEQMFYYAVAMDEDLKDEDWVPEMLKEGAARRKKHKSETPKKRSKYATGPVIANKSRASQYRHKISTQNQGTLTSFIEFSDYTKPAIKGYRAQHIGPSQTFPSEQETVVVQEESMEPESVWDVFGAEDDGVDMSIREESVEPILEWDSSGMEGSLIDSPDLQNVPELLTEAESWEEELDDIICEKRIEEGKVEIQSWAELREQITKDLSKAKKCFMPLSQINQLQVLRNFATLCLKGFGHIAANEEIFCQWDDGEGIHFARRVRDLARYYQVFEQLPSEKRGGLRTSQTLLSDENTQKACCDWLSGQKVGTVTSKAFQQALINNIFPQLNIDKSLSIRTACRWLIRLGWRLTQLWKGVYMDGHEREDVVKYRNKVFLPIMVEYERRMARWELTDDALTHIPPVLRLGEKEIIPQFHDKSTFHMNDFRTTAWLAEGQTVLQKKGRGHFGHMQMAISLDKAHHIIYPGANGDAWWDTKQLLEQVKEAISIFNEAHPGCTALFIFDQSSAHASLAPDALHAFEMNKSDGGAQRKQKDTIIPQSNPDPQFQGQIQTMTLPGGKAKGLQWVLEEWGFSVRGMQTKCKPVCPTSNTDCCVARLLSKQDDFTHQISMLETLIKELGHECLFLPKFHCELNPIEMYWGWCCLCRPYRSATSPTFSASRPDSEEESEQERTDCSALPHAYDVTDNEHIHLTTNREWNSCDQNQCPNALANSISEPYHLIDIDGSVLKSNRFIPVLPPLPPSPLPVHPVTPSLSRTPRHSRPGSRIGRHSRPTSCISPEASPAPRGPSISPFIPVTSSRTISPAPNPAVIP